MYRNDPSLEALVARLTRDVRVLQTQAPVGFTAVSRGALRILSNEGLIVDGSARVAGWLVVTGTGRVVGRLEGSGTLDWTGPWFLRGAGQITGNLNLTGDTTLDGDLSLGSGRFIAGPVVIDRLGPAGGRIRSSGQMIIDGSSIYLGASTTIEGPLGVSGFTNLQGLDVSGPKNFKMEHPAKPGHWLRHGATESPISGTEYTGRATIGADGSVVVRLPEYFEALNKPGNRTAQITPVGAPFPVGASEIAEGALTVYGDPGRDVFWLVKAERFGGDFLLEEPMTAES